MNDSIGPFDGSDSKPGDLPDDQEGQTEQIKMRNVGARVPEQVGKGVFSTGAIVMTGGTEFVVDFVQRMQRPHHVIARVVVAHAVMAKFIGALEQNIAKYENTFGKPKEMPKPPKDAPRTAIQDVYDELKLPDEMLSGVYANGVLIGHSAAEFSFDFITNFFPNSAVSCRVYMSASHVPPMLDSMKNSFRQFQERVAQAQAQQREQLENQQRMERNSIGDVPPPPTVAPDAAADASNDNDAWQGPDDQNDASPSDDDKA